MEGNPFSEGSKVVCISTAFPRIAKYGGTDLPQPTPKLHEVLVVDEILGDFLHFVQYDTDKSTNWWHHTRFAPVDPVDKLQEAWASALEEIN